MDNYKPLDLKRFFARTMALVLTAIPLLSSGPAVAADGKPDTKQQPNPSPAPPRPKKTKPKNALTGAELYALHCNRCHPERYAPERTPEQWKTILLHMRTRANLPAQQARTILSYLQEDSGK